MEFRSKFKSGIEDKTDKRAENLAIIRDKKKESKRIKIVRKINNNDNPPQQQNNKNNWAQLEEVGKFKGSLEKLCFIQNFLETNYNNKQELDAHGV